MQTTLNPRIGPAFPRALTYACQIHERQVRKGTQIPYLSHLIAVSALVLEANGTETEAIGALLHDAAEDQGGQERLIEINAAFGPCVARIVRDCSDTLVSEKAPWLIRKTLHVERLRSVPAPSFLVALADRAHNVECLATDLGELGSSVWTRFNAPAHLQLRILRDFSDIARTRASRDPRLRTLCARLQRSLSIIECAATSASKAGGFEEFSNSPKWVQSVGRPLEYRS